MAYRPGWIMFNAAKIAGLAVILGFAPHARPAMPAAILPLDAGPAAPGLSVMTYNVEGLPWPVRSGRQPAFDAIARRLRALRNEGRQPHIVVLQEAFSDGARAIGHAAGYRYIVDGPSVGDAPVVAPTDTEARFADAGRWRKGEGEGKWVGSGLQILSDYPVLSTARAAFPAFACAGFDCLANKGVVAATIAVPGRLSPVAIVDLHLNSRRASGVDDARSLVAYRMQIDRVRDFLARAVPATMPLIVSGDFNIGGSIERRTYAQSQLSRLSGDGTRLADALTRCAADRQDCPDGLSGEARRSLAHGKDWEFFRSGGSRALEVNRIAVPFGHAADGSMLSDHIGYTAYYS